MLTLPITLRSSAIIVGAIVVGVYVVFGGPSDVRKKKRRKYNVPGLQNIGNSCFLNSLVQALSSCPLFLRWLGRKHRDPSPPFVSSLHSLLQVLNNEDGRNGDACAGEVMCALKSHGWFISSEEQDAHELFHAVVATIDEELTQSVSLPSLLDVSWVEESTTDTLEIRDYRVVSKLDFWRQAKKQDCVELKTSGKQTLLIDQCNGNEESVGGYEVTKSLEQVRENGYEDDTEEHNSRRDQLPNIASIDNCDLKSDCDDNGCVRGANTNGHCNDLLNISSNERETNGKEDKLTTPVCDDSSIVEGAVVTDQRSSSLQGNAVMIDENAFDNVHAHDNGHSNGEVEADVSEVVSEKCAKLQSGVNSHNGNRGNIFDTALFARSKKKDCHNQSAPFESPFQGYLAGHLQCTLCGYKNPAQWTGFESLSLSLPSLPWGEVTLQELLETYITQEMVTDVTCDSCSKRNGADVKTAFTKQLTIGKLPVCLCFHIKRTVWMDNGAAIKRQDHVIFPEFLTMDPYTYVTSVNNQGTQSGLLGGRETNVFPRNSMDSIENLCNFQSSSVMTHNATSTEVEPSPFFRVTRVRCEQLYRLKAVIVHMGDVFCGHFVTYRRGALGSQKRNRWYYTSDLTVREANLEEVRKANAYMILYEKMSE